MPLLRFVWRLSHKNPIKGYECGASRSAFKHPLTIAHMICCSWCRSPGDSSKHVCSLVSSYLVLFCLMAFDLLACQQTAAGFLDFSHGTSFHSSRSWRTRSSAPMDALNFALAYRWATLGTACAGTAPAGFQCAAARSAGGGAQNGQPLQDGVKKLLTDAALEK